MTVSAQDKGSGITEHRTEPATTGVESKKALQRRGEPPTGGGALEHTPGTSTLSALGNNSILHGLLNGYSIIKGTAGWLSRLSVRLLVSAQVMILQFVSSSPVSASALTVQRLLRILSLPLSAPPLLARSLSLSQNK